MRTTKSGILPLTLLVILLIAPSARAAPKDCGSVAADVIQPTDQSLLKPIQNACLHGDRYKLEYRRRKIALSSLAHTWILEKIPKDYDPALVGADEMIGFLPPSFQIYAARNILLYISSIRSSGGNGGGQCGSGSEIFLNVLDLSRTRPRVIARHLIESCKKSMSIRKTSEDGTSKSLGDIATRSGKVVITYGFHGDYEDDPIATLSDDFKRLKFVGIRTPERIPN